MADSRNSVLTTACLNSTLPSRLSLAVTSSMIPPFLLHPGLLYSSEVPEHFLFPPFMTQDLLPCVVTMFSLPLPSRQTQGHGRYSRLGIADTY